YGYNGNESLDPTVVLKLMFLAFFDNARSEREAMLDLPMRLDWIWFCEMDVDDLAPDPSVVSKARRRWGQATFEKIFQRVLHQCIAAGLVEGETGHGDSTLMSAN